MFAYLIKQLLLLVPTLIGAVTFTFVVIQFVSDGPVEQMVTEMKGRDGGGEANGGGAFDYRGRRGMDAEKIKETHMLYGFDKSPLERYFLIFGRFARFDLGESYFQRRSVWDLIKSKLPASISIGLWTLSLTYLITVPLGIAKAVRADSRFDLVTNIIVLVGYATPSFVLDVLLLVLSGGGTFFQWFSIRGIASDNWDQLSLLDKITDYLWHIMLPVMASVVGSFAVITMLTKNALLEETCKQYVLIARSKGLSERRVLRKHIFRDALLSLVTDFPPAFIGAFFMGSLLIEQLSLLDGMGLLSYKAVMRRDHPIVFGMLHLLMLIGLAVRLISDVRYVLVNSRIHFGLVG